MDVSEVRTTSIISAIIVLMTVVRTSETSNNFNATTRRYIPEDSKLHTRHRENLKSHIQGRTASIIRAMIALMKAVCISETSINFNVTTRRYIPEDSKLHTRRCKNLKSHMH
jgi:predicted enzyme involved in methoxymalonyl-ACP biosynthesis